MEIEELLKTVELPAIINVKVKIATMRAFKKFCVNVIKTVLLDNNANRS